MRCFARGEQATATKPEQWLQRSRPTCALLLCFHARWLGGLHVLGGEVATQASPPSTHLASQIARAEAVPLRPVASG